MFTEVKMYCNVWSAINPKNYTGYIAGVCIVYNCRLPTVAGAARYSSEEASSRLFSMIELYAVAC